MQKALLAHSSRALLRSRRAAFLFALLIVFPVSVWAEVAKVVVFWQPDFPTVASQPIERSVLERALSGTDPVFAAVASLNQPATLDHAYLLVLPYGSAVPVDAWKTIDSYLHGGGNLLVLGGQPLRVPVASVGGKYEAARPQDTYARSLDFRHTYEVPVPADAQFAWKPGYALGAAPHMRAKRFFTVRATSEWYSPAQCDHR
jgi:hypothetical protein